MLPFNWDEKLLMGYDKQTRNDIAESAKAFDDFCARFQTYFSLMDESERWGRNELRWAYRKVINVCNMWIGNIHWKQIRLKTSF